MKTIQKILHNVPRFVRHDESTTLRGGFLAMLGFSALLIAGSAFAQAKSVVLTTVPAPYSIASSLVEGTPIVVKNIPEDGRRIYGVKQYLHKNKEKLSQVFSKADAVVTIGNLWREDPLFAAVREHNIRIVNVDATKPASNTLTGVSVLAIPKEMTASSAFTGKATAMQRPSIYCWLSLANGVRMADLIATDFMRLYPEQSGRIAQNLKALQSTLHDLRVEYEEAFASVENLSVFCLTSEFVYLTDDMGIYVDGYVLKQDIKWTDQDLKDLSDRLKKHDVPVVIHKWMPSEAIQKAISKGGAKLVVLNPVDGTSGAAKKLSSTSYVDSMRKNLEQLKIAFNSSSDS